MDLSRELSAVTIHVEHVKYTILGGILQLSLLSANSDPSIVVQLLVKVCLALVNLCPSMYHLSTISRRTPYLLHSIILFRNSLSI